MQPYTADLWCYSQEVNYIEGIMAAKTQLLTMVNGGFLSLGIGLTNFLSGRLLGTKKQPSNSLKQTKMIYFLIFLPDALPANKSNKTFINIRS